MPVRIISIPEPNGTLVKIDGRLKSVDVGELMRLFEGLDGPAALDLTELQSVDREGVVLLRELIDLGVELRAASPYVELLLKSGLLGQTDEDTA